MKKLLPILSALLLHAGATKAQFFQGFDNATPNNWTFTTAPAPYNNVSLNDVWDDTTNIGTTASGDVAITAAAQGTRFWAMNDLENPATTSLGAPYYHYMDFDPVALNPLTSYTLRFKYFTNLLHGTGDSLGYIAEYNNGTSWSMASYVHLTGTVQHWDSASVNIPAGSQYVRIRFRARINGNDDWAGIDAVQVIPGVTVTPPSVTLAKNLLLADEAADTLKFPVVIANKNSNPTGVKVAVLTGFGTTSSADITLLTDTLTFSSSTPDTQYVRIKVNNDALAEVNEYFGLALSNTSNGNLGSIRKATVYIKDNDYTPPVARKNITLKHLGSMAMPLPGSSAEIVTYDSVSNRLFVVNSLKNILHILSFSNPAALSQVDTIDMSQYGAGINSVAAHKGIIAVAVEASPKTDNGKIVFLDTAGNFLKQVTAGALPDMLMFSPDGRYVVSANEGEPASDYSVDPEGSVTIVDLQNGVQNATAVNATFAAYNGQEATLRSQGIRVFGVGANAAKDFEPEYVTISANSDTAWVTLQENNAIAVVSLASKTVTDLKPLRYVDHAAAGNALDASDQASEVLIANWPVRGMYLPDAINSFRAGGQTYLITANEGDARDYSALKEEARIGSNAYKLDSVVFPHADLLKASHNLGRLNATDKMGDIDNDGDYDEIYVYGGRGFSIWNSTIGTAPVFNSGDLAEQITLADTKVGKIFNSDNESNSFKNRSDNKGPEAEGVAIGTINDTTYAFVALERIGGVLVYDVSTPAAPVFVQYINTRDTAVYGGDNGAEGIYFIKAAQTPMHKNYIVTANEISGTVAVFEIQAVQLPSGIGSVAYNRPHINVYPNPVEKGRLFFSRPVSGRLCDFSGRTVRDFRNASSIVTDGLGAGMYLLLPDGFAAEKVFIK